MVGKNNISGQTQLRRLGDVCTYSKGKKPINLRKEWSKETSIPYINIKAFETGVFDGYTDGVKCNLCNEGDILMVWDGARCGLIGKAKNGAAGSTLMKIEPKDEIEKHYLYYFLLSKFHILNSRPKGVGIPHIEPTLLWNFELTVPSLTEQRAVVAKIEELFSELDNGIAQLTTAQEQLKIYKQSLLKAAFEGRLTNENVKDGELPKGWSRIKLGDLGQWKGGGTPSRLKTEFWKDGNNLWVTSKDMKSNIIIDSIDKITNYAIESSPAKKITKDAVLFVLRSGILRHTFPVAIAGRDLTVNQDLQSLTPNCLATSKFIFWYVKAYNNEIRQECSKDGTTVESIELAKLKNYPFILPPLLKQQYIIQNLETRLTVCDKIEETIKHGLQQAEMLRQSILKKAFEGKLIEVATAQQEAKVIPIYKPGKKYFYQVQVLGLIAKASKQNQVSHGEMTLAKYAYLTDRIFGVPTFYDYQRWHLGPYPPAIKKAINNKKFFRKAGSCIELVDEDMLFKYYNPYRDQIELAINELTAIFSKYDAKKRAHETELLATICKVVEDIQTIDIKAVRKSMATWRIELKGEKHTTKAEKFTEPETAKWLQFLENKGWDKKLLQQ